MKVLDIVMLIIYTLHLLRFPVEAPLDTLLRKVGLEV